ncbi:MAG: hypothetical protein GC181_04015 [Bacteroidetes bacterium]|nr:hypothetical protein [Bacteroidota bacterium]
MCFTNSLVAQEDILTKLNLQIDQLQQQIDSFDGSIDQKVNLTEERQTKAATELYIEKFNRIQENINTSEADLMARKRLLSDLLKLLETVRPDNYFLYNRMNLNVDMILRIRQIQDEKRMTSILKSDVSTSINVIPFYDFKPYAKDVLIHAARNQPSLLLSKFSLIYSHKYSEDVLAELCANAPMNVCFYMGNDNPVYRTMLSEPTRNRHPELQTMMKIFEKVGSNSRAYLLIDAVQKGSLSVMDAHNKTLDRDSLFTYLLKYREKSSVMASYSIDDEIRYTALKRVRVMNDLHEEADSIRFKVCDTTNLNSQELYALLVFAEDEIFTSTFLGLYSRMMDRMNLKSSFEFLHSVGMVRYRTFIKMCAAYNTLPTFLSRMNEWEKRALFNRMVNGLDREPNPLEEAVVLADTYGALANSEDKEIFGTALKKEYETIHWKTDENTKLYKSLLSVTGLIENPEINTDITELSELMRSSAFKKNEHIQQHFFFDDIDGRVSYSSFLQRFNKPGWTTVDKGSYVIVQSTYGRKVKLFLNKPTSEYAGQDAIREYFKKTGRFPDIVVHRGHSYYVSTTIESVTPSAELVILGSCGGYNNISEVMNYSPNAQIIASKQVGTRYVNNELIFDICEQLRQDKDVVWETLWTQVGKTLASNKTASERFADYLPPHRNLGVLLIRTYRKSL